MKGSFHENSVSLKVQDKAEFLLPSCIKFSLLCELSDHCFLISVDGLRLPSPSFADDISLLQYLHYILHFCRCS